MPIISIIMPAYNASCTISRMLESILAQTFKDWELIVINDGSTDTTSQIVEEYRNRDNRIKLINTENRGVAAARQTGLDNATGKYIIHLDSDDWCEKGMLKDMLDTAICDNTDIVICDYFTDAKVQKRITQKYTSKHYLDILKDIYERRVLGGLCNKLIKTELYKRTNASFLPNINYCEDVLIFTKMCLDGKPSISFIPQAYYHYVYHHDSITNRMDVASFQALKSFHKNALKLIDSCDFKDNIRKLFLSIEYIIGVRTKAFDKIQLKIESKKIRNEAWSLLPIKWKIISYFNRIKLSRISYALLNIHK